MHFYGHKNKTTVIEGNPVEQSTCNSFSELIHEYQVCKTVAEVVEARNNQHTARKAWSGYIVNCNLKKLD